MSVSFYIQQLDDSLQQEIMLNLRSLILSLDDRITEGIKYNIPFYSLRKNLFYLNPEQAGINLGLCNGTLVIDDFGILSGDGKVVRHIYIPSPDFIIENEEAIRATLYQLLDLDLNS